MNLRLLSAIGSVMVAAFLASQSAWSAAADEKKDTASEAKTAKGLHFKVPPDWPIEERNGVVGPIPLEEYLDRKFSGLESRMRTLEQQMSSLELRLRVVEEKQKAAGSTSGLRSGEGP